MDNTIEIRYNIVTEPIHGSVTRPVLENPNTKCPDCGMVFEPNKAYGYYCPHLKCPIQPKAIC